MKRTLLIDGDEFVYVSCAAVEYEAAWDEQNVILASNKVEAWDVLQLAVKKVKDAIGDVGDVVFAFGQGSFRKTLYPAYKSNRSGKRPPLCMKDVRAMVEDDYAYEVYKNLEGDDTLGIMATSGEFENPVIVSQDKDMLCVPGALWRKDELIYVSEGDADYHWLKQTLTGDSSDGYPGCPGVGPVGAEKLLNEFIRPEGGFETKDAWEAVVRTYEAKGLSVDDALVQARLARILRASDWDEGKQEVKLWAP